MSVIPIATLVPNQTSSSPLSGRTDAAGKFSSTLQWLSDGDFSIGIIASLSTSSTIPHAARVRVFDRLTLRDQPNTARVGSWKKIDHAWIDQDGTENTNGLVRATSGAHIVIEPGCCVSRHQ